MKRIIALSALATIFTSSAAMAANTVELKITGVIRAAACIPAFAGGATLDYGTIPSGTLSAGQYKKLDTKKMAFSVTCDAAIKMALKPVDNRSSSAVADAAGVAANMAYGLGAVSGKNVGAYVMTFDESTLRGDGNVVSRQVSGDGGVSWSWNQNDKLSKDKMYTWSVVGTGNAAPFKVVSGEITVTPYLNKPENLPLTQDIDLDGSTTFEITYL